VDLALGPLKFRIGTLKLHFKLELAMALCLPSKQTYYPRQLFEILLQLRVNQPFWLSFIYIFLA